MSMTALLPLLGIPSHVVQLALFMHSGRPDAHVARAACYDFLQRQRQDHKDSFVSLYASVRVGLSPPTVTPSLSRTITSARMGSWDRKQGTSCPLIVSIYLKNLTYILISAGSLHLCRLGATRLAAGCFCAPSRLQSDQPQIYTKR